MRISTFTRIVAISCIVVVMTGCGLASDNSAAKEVAAQFYDALKTGDAAKAASYCGTDDVMTTDAWTDLFKQNLNTMGNVTGYDSGSGFNVSKEGGKSTVRVAYEVSYEHGKSTDSLVIINVGEGFKVYEYTPKIKEARFQQEFEEAKAMAMEYMHALQVNNYDKALTYVGYSGSSKHTADEWKNFYMSVAQTAGNFTSIEMNNDVSATYLNDAHDEAGTGNVYSLVFTTQHPGLTVTHQIDVFQPTFDDELKIVAHNVQ